ncbi:MAG: hypothetical protein ACRDT1_11945 [Micromonosporaceae bacterium]
MAKRRIPGGTVESALKRTASSPEAAVPDQPNKPEPGGPAPAEPETGKPEQRRPSEVQAGKSKPGARKQEEPAAAKGKHNPTGKRKPGGPAENDQRDQTSELPGSTLVWVLLAGTMLWFAGQLWAVRGALNVVASSGPVPAKTIAALITYTLPTLVPPALAAGACAGMALRTWAPLQVVKNQNLVVRLAVGAGAGLAAAVITGGAVHVSGDQTAATVSVAAASLLGGLASAARVRVLAAGLAGMLTVAAIQIVAALFTSPLRGLLDGSGAGPEVADAVRRLAMITGVAAGIAAGVIAYQVLRRHRPVGLAGHIAAGGAAGAFLLISEVVSRIALAVVVSAAGGLHTGDTLVLHLTGEARLNSALVIFFVGALTSLIALGRSKPKRPPRPLRRGTPRG